MRVTYTWRMESSSGEPRDVGYDELEFSSQSDAETWIGEVWRELAAAGVDQVSLLESGRVVYGPMSLEAG
jgi:hypothetical protein